MHPFHLAIPVTCLKAAEVFYADVLGCKMGRRDDHWIDWDMFGHQVVTHLVDQMPSKPPSNSVDNKDVPVPHFGVVLDMEAWQQLVDKMKKHDVSFVIEPYVRFAGQPGEQATCFFYDPSGNSLEFKAFKDLNQLFAS